MRTGVALLSLLCASALVHMHVHATESPIELITATGTIKGTLSLPPVDKPVPVVVIIAGSGPTDRDGNAPVAIGRNDSLKWLALALEQHGIASVRYDKRGVAASAAAALAEADLRIERYAADAAAWVALLKADKRFSGTVLLGHSEGSLIAMLALQRTPAEAFISIAGPAEKASAILRRQLQGRLPADLAEQNEVILTAMDNGQLPATVPPPLEALYRQSVQPYLLSWFKYTPTAEIVKLRVPCLIVQGNTDLQVGMTDAQALAAANGRCTLRRVAGMNHVLKAVSGPLEQQIGSYGDPSLPLAPGLAQVLSTFVDSAIGATAKR